MSRAGWPFGRAVRAVRKSLAAIRGRFARRARLGDEEAAAVARHRAALRDPKLARYAGPIDPRDHIDRALGRK